MSQDRGIYDMHSYEPCDVTLECQDCHEDFLHQSVVPCPQELGECNAVHYGDENWKCPYCGLDNEPIIAAYRGCFVGHEVASA